MIKIKEYLIHKILIVLTKIRFWNGFKKLGRGTVIYKELKFYGLKNISIGNNVMIYKFSRIETISLWNKKVFKPEIFIGDNTSIEQNFHMTCAKRIQIGTNVVILPNVLITDIDHDYAEIDKNVLSQDLLVKNVSIGDYSFIGMGAKIMPGTKLGKNSIVGANSIVKGFFPDYCVIVGTPAVIIKRYNFDLKIWQKTNNSGEFLS